MKFILFLISGLVAFAGTEGCAQNNQLDSLTTYVQEIKIEFGKEGNQYKLLGYQPNLEFVPGFEINDVALKNGDLVINYGLPPVGLEKHFNAELAMISADGKLFRPGFEGLYGDHSHIPTAKDGAYQIIWSGIIDQAIPLSGAFEMALGLKGFGKRPELCGNEPKFSRKQKRPHYWVGAAGGFMAIASLPVEWEADRTYESYKRQTLEDEAAPILEDANKKRHAYLILRYGGIGVVALDALWYYIRHKQYRKDKRNYEKYCRFQLQPGASVLIAKYKF